VGFLTVSKASGEVEVGFDATVGVEECIREADGSNSVEGELLEASGWG